MKGYEEAIQFERQVASIFRVLGADVKHNASLAGNQIDILVTEQTPSGAAVHTAVECKYFARPVGVDAINSFASLAGLLRNRGLIEKAVLVSKSGFTQHARSSAETHGVDLVELEDLIQRSHGREADVQSAQAEIESAEQAQQPPVPQPKRAFVVMPFSPEFNDIYILGIREVAEQLGIIVERADSIEHNQSIPDVIREKIVQSDVVIADTTQHNPNVFYEIGLAHGIQKETILICRDAGEIPFDIAAINHVVYSSIVDLRERLRARLIATLNP
jgi:hypothetical protein